MNTQKARKPNWLLFKARTIGITVLVIAASTATIAASDSAGKKMSAVVKPKAKISAQLPDKTSAARLKTLLVARRDLMKQNEDRAKADRSAGRGNAVDVARATIGVLGAELELDHTKAERIALREQVVAAARLIEAEAESNRLAGVGNDESLFPARLARIEAEIALEREKLRPVR